MKLKLDPEVQALYIEPHEGEVDRTVELRAGVYADLDAERRVLGVEFVNADDFFRVVRNAGHEFVVPEKLVASQRATTVISLGCGKNSKSGCCFSVYSRSHWLVKSITGRPVSSSTCLAKRASCSGSPSTQRTTL